MPLSCSNRFLGKTSLLQAKAQIQNPPSTGSVLFRKMVDEVDMVDMVDKNLIVFSIKIIIHVCDLNFLFFSGGN